MPNMESAKNVPMVKSEILKRQVASGAYLEQFVAYLTEQKRVIVSMLQRFAQVLGSTPSMESVRHAQMVKSVTPTIQVASGVLAGQSVAPPTEKN